MCVCVCVCVCEVLYISQKVTHGRNEADADFAECPVSTTRRQRREVDRNSPSPQDRFAAVHLFSVNHAQLTHARTLQRRNDTHTHTSECAFLRRPSPVLRVAALVCSVISAGSAQSSLVQGKHTAGVPSDSHTHTHTHTPSISVLSSLFSLAALRSRFLFVILCLPFCFFFSL